MLRLPAGFLLLFACASAWAEPPKIDNIQPYGAPRGVPTDVTISGFGFADSPQLVAPFSASVEKLATSAGANYRFKILVPATTPLGVYPIRVKSDAGLSNPILFAVGQVPQVAEVEDNSVFDSAQTVTMPVVVEGQCAGTDVDHFRFAGKKGQKIIVDAQCSRIGSGVDPQIRLTTASRKFVESADDTPGLMTDARLSAILPEDGDYVVELSDSKYQGGGRPVYRLTIGEIPVAAEVYPLGGRRGETVGFELRGGSLTEMRTAAGTLSVPALADIFHLKAPSAPWDIEIPAVLDVSDYPELRESADPNATPTKGVAPVVFNGRIDPAGDVDRFTLAVLPGQALRIRVDASELASALDGTLQILGPAGNVLAAAEDTMIPAIAPKGSKKPAGLVSPDPSLDFAVPAGVNEITLSIRDLIGRGGVGFPYRVTVEPIVPGFQVQLADSQLTIPRGGTVIIAATVVRQAFNGPITLVIADPPAGLSFRPSTIPAGQVAGMFTATASSDATFGPVDLKVVGTGQGPNGPLADVASKLLIFAQQGNVPTNSQTQTGLPSAVATPLPAAIDSPSTPVEVVHGYGGSIPLKVVRQPASDGVLAISSLPLPPGMVVTGTIAEKANEGAANLTLPAESPFAPATLFLNAKGKVGGKDVSLMIPSVTIDVVRPVSVELSVSAVEVKAGGSVEVKGKIVRKPVCKEPVTVELAALPAGVKGPSMVVPPEATEFTLKLDADAAAAASQATSQVAIKFQINKKDYATPTTGLTIKVIK